ncbi:DEAD/DEAH box helicase family protein [Facklamia languida]
MYELYDYQKDLIERARKLIKKNNIMIVSPPGSGKSVVIAEIAKSATERGGRVLFLVHRKELIEQIRESLSFNGVDLSKVDLLTVIKAKNRLGQLTNPTLIITDEGHHGKATTYQAIYDYFEDVPRLGFTATPWRMSGESFLNIYDTMVEGKSVKWLIDHQRLAPFKYYSLPSIDTKKLKVRNGEYSNKSIDEAIGTTIFGNIVEEYLKHAKGEQAILYAHSIEYSKRFAEEFNLSNIKAVHADAKTPPKERDKIMKDFKEGKTKVLCNVDLISEGFNVPDCSVTILCRPTKSLVLHLQQSMRSMRYRPGKTAIILDTVMNWQIHGLPDEEHDWDKYFKGWKKRKGQNNEVNAKQCPECSAMWPLNQEICELCGHVFENDRDNEKQRIEAELVEITRKHRLQNLANKKFNGNVRNDWPIAQARAELKGGKPLYKLIFFYVHANWTKVSIDDIVATTGASPWQVHQAINWINKKTKENN